MSEEIMAAIGTIEYWQHRAEQAEALARTLQSQRDAAEADATAMRSGIDLFLSYELILRNEPTYKTAAAEGLQRAHDRLVKLVSDVVPGARLRIDLAELEAARAVVESARERRHELPGDVIAALAKYDQAVKARKP